MRYGERGSVEPPACQREALGLRYTAKLCEYVEKLREGNAYALGVANYRVTFGAERCHREPSHSTREREQHTFGEQLTYDPPPPSAQRSPHRDFFLP